MRGDKSFREASKAYLQFANEIYFYSTIMPAYEKFLKELNLNEKLIRDLLPQVYQAKFGYIEGLSSRPCEQEASLVMENLSHKGYQLGPAVFLERQHLLAMSEALGKLHGLCYAFKVLKPLEMANLIKKTYFPYPLSIRMIQRMKVKIFIVFYIVVAYNVCLAILKGNQANWITTVPGI